jgi:hypothetical protein
MAETEGFEPSIHLTAYDDLANRCLQPLGHVSIGGVIAVIWCWLQEDFALGAGFLYPIV